MVVKRHSDWVTYFRELRGFELLGNQAPIARLIAASDSDQFIVMEYLPDAWDTEMMPLCEVAKALGRLHACGSRNSRFLKWFSQEATLGFLIRNTDSYAWAEDVEALREALSLASLKLGESYVPIELGDFKEGHLRARDGECVLIDLETLTVGGIEWFDILSLLNIMPKQKLDASELGGAGESLYRGTRQHRRAFTFDLGYADHPSSYCRRARVAVRAFRITSL